SRAYHTVQVVRADRVVACVKRVAPQILRPRPQVVLPESKKTVSRLRTVSAHCVGGGAYGTLPRGCHIRRQSRAQRQLLFPACASTSWSGSQQFARNIDDTHFEQWMRVLILSWNEFVVLHLYVLLCAASQTCTQLM